MSKKDYYEISQNENSSIVANVPHSSIFIPQEFLGDYLLNFEDLKKEVKYMADNYTDSLFSELLNFSSFIKSNISRIVLDTERFKDEKEEPMSKFDMSALYSKTSDGKVLRKISEKNEKLLMSIYDNYHQDFTNLVEKSLEKNGIALIVDCHSFPNKVREYDIDQGENRPDICLGTDVFHTPKGLENILKENFEKENFKVKINSPFSGSIVPMKYYKKNKKVISVMVEVNRRLYMNEENFEANDNINSVGRKISRIIMKSISDFLKMYEK